MITKIPLRFLDDVVKKGGLVWKADFHGRVHREQKVVSKLL